MNEQITLASGNADEFASVCSVQKWNSLTSGICDVPPGRVHFWRRLQNTLITKHPRSPDLSPCEDLNQRHKDERS